MAKCYRNTCLVGRRTQMLEEEMSRHTWLTSTWKLNQVMTFSHPSSSSCSWSTFIRLSIGRTSREKTKVRALDRQLFLSTDSALYRWYPFYSSWCCFCSKECFIEPGTSTIETQLGSSRLILDKPQRLLRTKQGQPGRLGLLALSIH